MSFFSPVMSAAYLLLLAHLQLVQPRLQLLHGGGAVLVLGALVLAGDDDAGRHMGDADRRLGLVDVLAAGAAGAVGVDAQILVVDLDFDVVGNLGKDEDRGEGGMAAGVGIEGGDAHQPVNPLLGPQIAVGVVALRQ